MPILLIFFCAVVVIFILAKLSRRPPHFPPGKIDYVYTIFTLFCPQYLVTLLVLKIGSKGNTRETFATLTGPRGAPLLGYAPFLPKKEPLFKAMQKLAEEYGPVTGFYLGTTQPFISVVGTQAVKEALQNNDLNGRPSGALLLSRTFGERLGNISELSIKF
jgi:Cytochrome P450